MEYKTGTLVEFRNRPWVVQQSSDDDIMLLKPLGGTDVEAIGLYKPLYGDDLDIKSYEFRRPSADDIGRNSFQSSAQILYNACRLSFRDVAGPFQCLGRLSFEPRPYQMVPLILALKQDPIRLLISDDVGIGKTLESLLIAKELLDRNEIKRFAVVCLPHLCEQWQNEIKDKFGLDAEIIRSSTISKLEKRLRGDQNVFRDIPYQVISIDYVKQRQRMGVFLDHCPEFIIVDEAHTCARPKGANNSQQQRYNLLRKIAENPKQQLVLLTATPHSGQSEEFQSLIGLLNKDFEQYTLQTPEERQKLSHHFIQRRRADIEQYLGDEAVFPVRVQIDEKKGYQVRAEYSALLNDLIKYVKSGVEQVKDLDRRKQRYIYWDLLALMRGVMSSPESGISMLKNKINKRENTSEMEADASQDTDENVYLFNDNLKDLLNADDVIPDALETIKRGDKMRFAEFIARLEHIKETDNDQKVKEALESVKFSLNSGKNPIVFCQYIQTAEYVGAYITKHLKAENKYKKVEVGIVTSRLTDEERKMKIDDLSQTDRHVLVCTDCLSEGVNLQQGFDAVIHYDLPWNPNRMEQRNGRIDRFGQTSREVLVSTIHASNNPVDDIVLNILYKKQKEIRDRLGIYLPIAENDASLMEEIMQRIFEANAKAQSQYMQPSLFSEDDLRQDDVEAREFKLKQLEENEKISHTYFAHNTKKMDPTNLKSAIAEAREVIGGVEDTCHFVVQVLSAIGVNVIPDSLLCYHFNRADLPATIAHYFKANSAGQVKISFASPTPKGYQYIGRNHAFVESLSRNVINDTINGGDMAACRAMVIETAQVDVRTTILMMRVRSVIRDKKQPDHELVGEEMIFVGYRGRIDNHDFLDQETCKQLFNEATASGNVDITSQRQVLTSAISWTYDLNSLRQHTDEIALKRAGHLVDAFTQYRTYVGAKEYQVAEPVLPMDVIAAYVFIPPFKR